MRFLSVQNVKKELFLPESMELKATCPKCQGKKRIMGKDGTIGPCFDCLAAGEMDQHSKNPKDSGVKI